MKRVVWIMIFISLMLYAKTQHQTRAEIIEGIKKYGDIYISNFDENIRKDKEIVLIAVKANGTALEFVDKSMQDDKEVVLTAVKKRGNALKFASKRLKKDEEVVFAAVKNNAYAIQYADKSLQHDKKFLDKIKKEQAKRLAKANSRIKYNEAVKKDKLKPRQCRSYNPQSFIAYNENAWRNEQYTSQNEIKQITEVQIWKKKWTKKLKIIEFVLKTGKHVVRNPFMFCKENDGGYACHGEDDSGSIYFDSSMRLHLESLYFTKETKQDSVVEVILKSKNDRWLQPKVMQCPEYVYEGHYVCYSKKIITSNLVYEGCVRSHVSCGSIRKRHFGHYLNDAQAEDAYYRCKQNR